MRVYLSKDFDVRCRHCGRIVSYSQRYDALFCMPCNAWLEEQCADPACEFCAERASEPDGVRDLDMAKPAEAEHAPPLGLQLSSVSPISRNQPCPCGSGTKYKKCCGARKIQAAPRKKSSSNGAHFLSRLSRINHSNQV